MNYKILLVSLLSTLSVPYGTAAEKDCGRERRNINPHRIAIEEEIAEHEAKTQRIAEQEMALCQDVIDLVHLNLQVGGSEAVDLNQQFQTLTEALENQVTSLETTVNNLTTVLADIPGDDLFAKVTYLTQAREKEKITKQGLRQVINAMKHEQAETNMLIDDVLKQHLSSVPQSSLPLETQPPSDPMLPSDTLMPAISSTLTPETPTGLSSYQEELLPRRHQIGGEAWKLLGGENTNLAAALSKGIQQNSGMVEILFLGKQNFTLCINGEEQYYPYDF